MIIVSNERPPICERVSCVQVSAAMERSYVAQSIASLFVTISELQLTALALQQQPQQPSAHYFTALSY